MRILVFAVMTVLAGALAAGDVAAGTLLLHYYERPPYMVSRPDGGAGGLTAGPAEVAFRKAGIPFTWALMPASRQLELIRSNVEASCAVGWFKNAERAAYGTFTHAIYRDRPPVVIAHPGFAPPAGATLAQTLADKNIKVLVKVDLTYGGYIGDLLQSLHPSRSNVTVEQKQMVRMIAARRADIMFATREEADVLTADKEEGDPAVRVIEFPDIPPGEPRYILCSRMVEGWIIKALNAAIDTQ